MSGKIEISREQLEQCLRDAELFRFEHDPHLLKLRALLAAPVVECQVMGRVYHFEDGARCHLTREGRALSDDTPLYASPPAPVAVDAARAFAKGFNTLETVGGKYKIVMQFAGHDDAWEAYSALSQMTACLDKVKELNQ